MRKVHQVSAGGVVYRELSGRLVIALCHRWRRTVWCLPKGHLDPGESTEEAALREVREEAGLEAEIVEPLGEISYEFVERFRGSERLRIAKRVTFFLMRRTGGSIRDHDDEVDGVRYFPIDEVVRVAKFPSEKQILRKAVRRIRRLHRPEGRRR